MAHRSSTHISTAARGLSSTWGRVAAGAVMVIGGVMASTSAMNARADIRDGAPPKPGFQRIAHQPPGPAGFGAHGGPGGRAGAGVLDPRRLDRLLDEVKATESQRAQIRQISGAARDDLRKLHEGGGDLREQSLNLLTQPKIDTAAAEAVRQKMLARQDAMSKRTLTAMLDVAKVLTPEQRTLLGEKMQKRQERFEQRREERAQPGGPRGSERQ